MSRRPPRLLCCWSYAHAGRVAPFERLAEAGRFEVHYLFYRRPQDEPKGVATRGTRHFWESFKSGQQAIRRLRPDIIVFMEVDGAWSVGLNLAARRSRTATALLTHGAWNPYQYFANEVRPDVDPVATAPRTRRLVALSFLIRSGASPSQIRAVAQLVGSIDRGRGVLANESGHHAFDGRRVDRYLVHGTAAIRRILETHGDVLDRVRIVGLPEHDELFLPLPKVAQDGVLLIDTPNTGNPYGSATIDPSEKHAQLVRLAAELRSDGLRLVVKLHPDSYGDGRLADSSGLTYVREARLRDLLARSRAVIGFESTLLIPAAHHRPLLLIASPSTPSYIADRAAHLGAAVVVPTLSEVSARSVLGAIADQSTRRAARAALVHEFAGEPDGRALERLRQELMDLLPA